MNDLQDLIYLSRPTHYESCFRNQNISTDAEARRLLLKRQIERLIDVGWLGSEQGVLSIHLLDWDLRKPERDRFNKHIPMHAWDSRVLAWYSMLGLLISSDPERMRYTLTHHVFEHMPRRDAARISLTSKSDVLFTIRQVPLVQQIQMHEPRLAERDVFSDSSVEQGIIHIEVSLPLVEQLLCKLNNFRNDLHVIVKKRIENLKVPWNGTLEEAQGYLLDDKHLQSSLSYDLTQAAELFGDFTKSPFGTA